MRETKNKQVSQLINVFANYGKCSEENEKGTLGESDGYGKRWQMIRPEVRERSSFVKGNREVGRDTEQKKTA